MLYPLRVSNGSEVELEFFYSRTNCFLFLPEFYVTNERSIVLAGKFAHFSSTSYIQSEVHFKWQCPTLWISIEKRGFEDPTTTS